MAVARWSRLDTLQNLELAEGVEIRLRIAGPFLRFLAFALDLVFQWLAFALLGLLLSMLSFAIGSNVADGLFLLAIFGISWFYFVLMERGKKGATFGKRIVGLRVVRSAGGRLTWGQAMIRNFVRIVDVWFPLLPLVAFFNKKFQRLGDLAADTLVVYAKEVPEEVLTGPPALVDVPVGVALRREEEAAILRFRDRSGYWSDVRRIEMARHVEPLTGETGPRNVAALMGMARWLDHRK